MQRYLWIVLALAACATPYQPKAVRGGYSDIQLNDNVFRVTFEGNGFTAASAVSDYALLRSAEITLEKGFRYFSVNAGETATTVSGGGGAQYSSVYSNATVINTIVCYRERPADAIGLVYDAQQVSQALHGRYNPPKEPPRAVQQCASSPDCAVGVCIEGYCR